MGAAEPFAAPIDGRPVARQACTPPSEQFALTKVAAVVNAGEPPRIRIGTVLKVWGCARTARATKNMSINHYS
ncbi:hypothetical protein MCOL_V224677 [Mycobacterium colombiense CECT 3035]|uniref:Uncharacterized protein n=1 Tax=Mycobacterium colombiense CECT 3035 TaxID=1041522 RepID=J4JTV5_9MYCO|nr:hypothetical protein MCOL_V224677 [Mycobacterium colombiense CECT 3035]